MITRGLLSIEISCDKAGCETPAETVVVGLAPDHEALSKRYPNWYQVSRGRVFCKRCYEAGTRLVHEGRTKRYMTGIAGRIMQGDEVLATIGVELGPGAQSHALDAVRQRLARETD